MLGLNYFIMPQTLLWLHETHQQTLLTHDVNLIVNLEFRGGNLGKNAVIMQRVSIIL